LSDRVPAVVRCTLAACVLAGASCLSAPATAALVETVIDVPVSLRTRDGPPIDQTIKVTVFHDDARISAPYLVLHHGRPGDRKRRAGMGRQRHLANARYFYSANDRSWGSRWPREWFNAFVDAGGRAAFVPLPAHGTDGHSIFSRDREAWKPAFEAFIRQLGF